MKTLIIYDSIGQIFSSPITGNYIVPQGELKYLEIEIPKEKTIRGIDTTVSPNVPIFDDIKLSETEILKQQLLETQSVFAEMQYNTLLNIK